MPLPLVTALLALAPGRAPSLERAVCGGCANCCDGDGDDDDGDGCDDSTSCPEANVEDFDEKAPGVRALAVTGLPITGRAVPGLAVAGLLQTTGAR
mmetsp:Transcript_66961/g.169097  ORF Transcript_66961/g.169097 Transcript_66961/m.169097 type:complete len:96 (+) Transcript_66961:284-571(+)